MRRKNVFALAVGIALFILVGLFFVEPVEAAHFAQGEGFEETHCMFDLPAEMQEGEDILCGYVTVPELHSKPNGRRIRLAVVVIKSQYPSPEADPIFFAQGGPGGSTIGTYASLLLDSNSRLLANRDIVLFDQRGTYYSEPALVCTEVMDITIESLEQNLSTEESNRLYDQALQDCHERLTAQGINLSAFNSLENAGDIDSIRVALGYEQINLYGVSYGTLLALHTMRLYPQMLRSVVIDSVVPTQRNFILGAPLSEDRSFTLLFDSCKEDPACNRSYPNLETVFFDLQKKLNETPAEIEMTDSQTNKKYTVSLNGDNFMGSVFQLLYSSEMLPLLPRMIYDAQNGKFGVFERIQSLLTFDYTMSDGMYYSVICAEDADYETEDYDLSGIHPQIREAEASSAEWILETCRMWDVNYLGPELDEPVTSDIPTLLLTGNYDPITPPDYARQAAETLSNSFLVVFPDGGHGEVASSACADQIFLEFVDHPDMQPDTSCLSEHEKVSFFTSKNILYLDMVSNLLALEPLTILEFFFFLFCLACCCTVFLVYPVVWLVRILRNKPVSPNKPFWQKLLPWLAALNVVVLGLFFVGFVTAIIIMAVNNDMRFFYGFPMAWFPLFLLPLLALFLSLCLLGGNFTAWIKGYGSLAGRLYGSLVVLANWGAMLALTLWGAVGFVFINH